MTRQKFARWALNGATAVTVLCAALVTALRVRDAFSASGQGGTSSSDSRFAPRHVADWRRFAVAGHRVGPDSATVTIIEYADFQCPFCRKAVAGLKALRARYPHDLAVVYRHYPSHEFSFAAAVASECAARSTPFEFLHDSLYRQADSIGKKSWSRFAQDVGVDDTLLFTTCMRDSTIARYVVRDTLSAAVLGVRGTPTFLVNDVAVMGFKDEKELDSLIANLLARHRSGE